MIKGMQLHINSDEMKKILEERRDFHLKKTTFYEKNLKEFTQVEESGVFDNFSNSSVHPTETLKDKVKKHKGKSEYFQFLVDHVVPSETYELSESDLTHLGIITYYY